MSYTFDGPNKLIILAPGAVTLDVKDMYSRWKEWVALSDNTKYTQALRVVGGDPTVGANSISNYFFIMNAWRVRPQEASHVLTVTGTLIDEEGEDPFTNTIGTWRVRIVQIIPLQAETIAVEGGGGGSAPTTAQIVSALLNAPAESYDSPGTIGRILNRVMTVARFLAYGTPPP